MSDLDQKRPMRAVMPDAVEMVDAFRDAGLTDDDAIRAGMRSGGFWAQEGDTTVGKLTKTEEAELVARSREAGRRAAAAWDQECRTNPRLAHCYYPALFAAMADEWHGGAK